MRNSYCKEQTKKWILKEQHKIRVSLGTLIES
uniref:Uncharacterized protein n=1 Tax=Arundo donax TaxID=35708 RepID=A0A0A9A2S6_ARUDO